MLYIINSKSICMNQQVKYLILAILLIANLIYQCTYNFSLWNIFTSSLIIIILFYQFADIAQNKVSKFLTYVMMVVCLIEMYIGIKNNDWLLVYGFFGFNMLNLPLCLFVFANKTHINRNFLYGRNYIL